MGIALYRKYRSKSLDEIVGQPHITRTLQNALKQNRISHAYLFSGPRGVGKTSIARILARAVNDLEYNENSPHLDIIEIDAASNRRIDEIRELRERVHVAPASAKYKVYIIDEVHMLTREAFNALLKTLEEPPKHAIFILATTETHKLPETIISRTQRFNFKPIETSEAVNHLRKIAKSENIQIEDEALRIIAEHGEGSFRDSISLLDQISDQTRTITAEIVLEALGTPPKDLIRELLSQVYSVDKSAVLKKLDSITAQGYQAAQIAKQLSQLIRARLVEGQGKKEDVELLKQLIEIPASHDPATLLEIILLGTTPLNNPIDSSGRLVEDVIVGFSENTPDPPTAIEAAITPKTAKATDQSSSNVNKLNDGVWPAALMALRQNHNTLYGIARMANASYDNNALVLSFSFPFHQKRMAESKNNQLLKKILKDIVGTSVTITCKLENKPVMAKPKTQASSAAREPEVIDTISNIFGGAEVIE